MSESRRRRRHRGFSAARIVAMFGGLATSRQWKVALLPCLLTLFLIFGGASGESYNVHALLLCLCGVICAVAILGLRWDAIPISAKWLIGFLFGYTLLGVLHLIELPIGLWNLLGGREMIKEGWDLLELNPSFEPLSVAPARTHNALVYVLIPLAAVLLLLRLGWRAVVAWLPWTVVGLGAFGASLGLAQVLLPSDAGLYIYQHTNEGLPVGLFANVNHQASFLLMSLAFSAVLIGELRSREKISDVDMAKRIVIGLSVALQILGVLTAGSVAGYLLLLPALAMGVLIVQSQRREFRIVRLAIPAMIIIPMIMLVAYSPQLSGLGVTSIENDGPTSRAGIVEISVSLLQDHIWLGGGLGSFEPLFKVYEDPETVGLVFANHAHNEYLQWAIETGLVGMSLLVVFLGWLMRQLFRVWRSSGDRTVRLRRAAATAISISLLHSFVDYPLRSPSILFFASVCVVLLILPQRQAAKAGEAQQSSKALTL
ncbi:MAG: O-antigen ligase family protein [Pseudomonadota bacterium]